MLMILLRGNIFCGYIFIIIMTTCRMPGYKCAIIEIARKVGTYCKLPGSVHRFSLKLFFDYCKLPC